MRKLHLILMLLFVGSDIDPNLSQLTPVHVHCAQKKFCIHRDDVRCCSVCGGVCP